MKMERYFATGGEPSLTKTKKSRAQRNHEKYFSPGRYEVETILFK